MNKVKIAGIDPGLASGGIVVIEGWPESVIYAKSLVASTSSAKQAAKETGEILSPTNGWGDKEFTAAVLRAEAWRNVFVRTLHEILDDHDIDVFAIESFVDQRSRAREEKQRLIKNRWHTPLVMGMIHQELEKRDFNVRNHGVVYQNAGIVIKQANVEIAQLKARKSKEDLVVPGDRVITNDHLRKALAHALALSLRLKEKNG